ncbi:MAG TPA: hypothetical protein VF805_15985 [Anaeromyxobacteraceae bacterium]
MAMSLRDRLRLARATYLEALEQARLRNGPAAWRRLVRTGENLREAEVAARGRPAPSPRKRAPRGGRPSRP